MNASPLLDFVWEPALHSGQTAAPYSLLQADAGTTGYGTHIPSDSLYGPTALGWNFVANGPQTAVGGQYVAVVRPVRPVPIRHYPTIIPQVGEVWGPMPEAYELYPGLPGFTCCGCGASPSGTAWFIEDAAGSLCWCVVTGGTIEGGLTANPCRDSSGAGQYTNIEINVTVPIPVGNQWPNIIEGNVIAYRMELPGLFSNPGGCLDDAIGTIKIWPDDGDLPQGWEDFAPGAFLSGGGIGTTQARSHTHAGSSVVCESQLNLTEAIEAGDSQKHLPPYRVVRWIRRAS